MTFTAAVRRIVGVVAGGLSGPSACLGVALPNVPAVTALGPVGVDLEPVGAGDFDGLADVALTPRERLALRRLPSEQRSSAALTWWVRKEAVLKATGDGMFVAPADIEVSGPAEEPRLIAGAQAASGKYRRD